MASITSTEKTADQKKEESSCISKFRPYFKVDDDWFKELRGHLITAATLTATMAYQSILSPPGGFWQDTKERKNSSTSPAYPPSTDNPDDEHKAGRAINSSDGFTIYMVLNSIVLVASLSTIMLAMTGLPMKNKFLTWSMVFTVYLTLVCLGAAYTVAINFVFPQLPYEIVYGLSLGWAGLLAFIMVLHLCHFLVWLGILLKQAFRKCCKPTTKNNNEVRQT